jgi:hypothetical protein
MDVGLWLNFRRVFDPGDVCTDGEDREFYKGENPFVWFEPSFRAIFRRGDRHVSVGREIGQRVQTAKFIFVNRREQSG